MYLDNYESQLSNLSLWCLLCWLKSNLDSTIRSQNDHMTKHNIKSIKILGVTQKYFIMCRFVLAMLNYGLFFFAISKISKASPLDPSPRPNVLRRPYQEYVLPLYHRVR